MASVLRSHPAYSHFIYELLNDRATVESQTLTVFTIGQTVDPMPHPHVPEPQSTHPHHKHTSPDIKHHRLPAPMISFEQPNLPHLLAEVESTKD